MVKNMVATIHIKNLRLRTFIGFNEEERIKKQDVVINITLNYDASAASQTDNVDDACNYKVLTKQVIERVESQSFNLLEKMAADIIELIRELDEVLQAEVEIDKPHALRFADSVSVKATYNKSE